MGCTNFIYLLFFLVFFTIAAAADPIKKLKSEVNVEAHDEQHPTRFEVLFFYFYHSNYRFFFFFDKRRIVEDRSATTFKLLPLINYTNSRMIQRVKLNFVKNKIGTVPSAKFLSNRRGRTNLSGYYPVVE